MTIQDTKSRSYLKIKADRSLIAALKKDTHNFLNKKQHVEAIGITFRSYVQLLEDGMVRSDVIDKVNNYLQLKSSN